MCAYCGTSHENQRSSCRRQKRNVITVQRLVILQECVELQTNSQPFRNTKTTAKSSLLTVQARINGIKGQVEADSCSTANIIDEARFGLLQNALKKKLKLKPANTKLYAYGQEKTIPLIGSFEAEVESISTGKKTIASFLVAKGKT